jgi:hypothetical protein
MSQNKHIVNDPRNLANESLAGLARLNSKIKVDATHRVVHLADVPKERVAIVGYNWSSSRAQSYLLIHVFPSRSLVVAPDTR